MKAVSEPFKFVGETARGKTHTQMRQYFEIEKGDTYIPHWLGHNRGSKPVYKSDIGKIVCSHWDSTGWSCFSFKSGES